jgi:hypothetical protein
MMSAPRWFAPALFALGAGLAALAVCGPLGFGVIEYRYETSMQNQAVGLDAFALAVVAPVAVLAGVLARRSHPAAPFVALAPSGFALYMLVQYVIGPEYLTVAGNGERFFLLFVGLFVLSGSILLQAWSLADADAVGPPALEHDEADRRRGTILLGLAAFVVFGMYLANDFVSAMTDFPAFVAERAATSEIDEHPTAYWLVAALDLAVVVPITIATGVALLRHHRWARRAFYGVIGWFALVPGSVAAMAITMVVRDDPAADAPKTVVLTLAAVAFTALGAAAFRPLFRPSGSPGIGDTSTELEDVSTTLPWRPAHVRHHRPRHAHR